ncbi:DUF7853 family protein [Salinarchaeum laminariae]|uniref:DUF7853 family protein n=1 Tax=Salinarchaeum laminariae TaxID=869888 RepID=UPI0020BFC7D5|nr:hypothetical protein [Salinarchaeum laminariae]
MSTTTTQSAPDGLNLSRAEQWVLHHVMVEHVDRAYETNDSPPWWAVSIAGKLETGGDAGPSPGTGVQFGDRVTTFEAWRIRQALVTYADRTDVPEGDADLAWRIVERLDGSFEAAPRAIR